MVTRKELEEMERFLVGVPARYLPAYELESNDINSPYVDKFNEFIEAYLSDHVDNCLIYDSIFWTTPEKEDEICFEIRYRYDCEEFPYNQKDVDDFDFCHLNFEGTYTFDTELDGKDLVDIVKEMAKDLNRYIEFEVEDEAERYSRYDPCDEYIKPEERWPNDE